MERKNTLVVLMMTSILVLVGFSANEKAYAGHVFFNDQQTGHEIFGDFTCWAAVSGQTVGIGGNVVVEDQFGTIQVEEEIWEKAEYCAATNKAGEDSPFANTDPPLAQHYQSWFYPDGTDGAGTGQQVILYVPQFRHSFLTEVGVLDQLMIPADKHLVIADENVDSVDLLQHWNCYNISEPAPITDNVDLETEHGFINDVEIGDAFLLCTPAAKALGGPAVGEFDIEEHRVCYDITANDDQTDTNSLFVQLTDQFVNLQLFGIDDTNFSPNGLEKICVPAEKRFPTDGGTDVSINSSALLLAGARSVSMWMIPVVIACVGIGIFVIKRRN